MTKILFLIRMRFGMGWPSSLPPINWSAVFDVVLILMFLAACYLVVQFNDDRTEARLAHRQTAQMLDDCISNKATFLIDNQAARCRLEWIQINANNPQGVKQ